MYKRSPHTLRRNLYITIQPMYKRSQCTPTRSLYITTHHTHRRSLHTQKKNQFIQNPTIHIPGPQTDIIIRQFTKVLRDPQEHIADQVFQTIKVQAIGVVALLKTGLFKAELHLLLEESELPTHGRADGMGFKSQHFD